MAKINQISKDQPNELEINNLLKNNIFSNLNCHNVGRITAFDKDTQLCTVELLQVKQYIAKSFLPVPITNVPLIILGGGGGHITMPDPVGTICLLIFMDRNIDNFLETGEAYTPETTRMHDFTDCIALSTFKTLANPLANYDENAVSILNSAVINEVQSSTALRVYPNFVDLLTSGKVRIANGTQNLASLMQNFLSLCEGITVDTQTGVITTASQQSFANLAVLFNELLSSSGYTPPTPTPTEAPTSEPTEAPVTPEEAQAEIEASFATARPIGEPIFRLSDYLADDEIRLEGATVSRSNYYLLFTKYGTTYGEGDGSTTFQLPDFRNRAVWGATDFGYLSAGLPNITGRFSNNGNAATAYANGALNTPGKANYQGSNSGGGQDGGYFDFDASSSSSIYGNSSTVQPPAIKVRAVTRYM